MRETLITAKHQASILVKPCIKKPTSDISIKTLLESNDIRVSTEISPNRNFNANVLSSIQCNFCSVTWRTPSSEELRNVETIPAISLAKQLRSHGYNVLLHLPGRNLNASEAVKILRVVKDAGITNLFALQGDPSEIKEKDDKKCDFPYAANLVKFIRSYYGNFFTVGVAGYPEKHPTCENVEKDLEHLQYKVSCGADFIITQAAYDYQTFASFSQQCRSMGIEIPIIPGMFIISSYRTLMAMSKFCGVPITKNILNIVEANKNNDAVVREYGISLAAGLMKNIIEHRELFGGVHVFSLNNLELLRDVFKRVGFYSEIGRPLMEDSNFKAASKRIMNL